MTAKKVPGWVPDMTSTITRRPEMAHALIKPAREQYSIYFPLWFVVKLSIFFYKKTSINTCLDVVIVPNGRLLSTIDSYLR